jgi:imidazolonepropionase-like amidohydrolase
VNPTLHVARAGLWAAEAALQQDPTPPNRARVEFAKRSVESRMEVTGRLAKLGIGLTAGSDSPWSHYAPGLFVHEVELMRDAGLSNIEALVAATSGAAASIGLGDNAGWLKPGKQADVLVVEGDATANVGALWKVRDVFQAGKRVERGVL